MLVLIKLLAIASFVQLIVAIGDINVSVDKIIGNSKFCAINRSNR